ncbi:methylamine dehydrogenase accessory protein MauD [Achromobacter seleniivolatilans]|uniref:Methylamine utilization protein MauD n=1 Tax=Achromobacter seleniivolatilans TaxID=3047478 RepID=A0ABY9LUV7_9BURK|nr:methylamine dehydrogenase accessory protein MauD [Achromobacter sp. R39]WMD18316.1 methylamine dehydrogenase accessory protein MauD [Achromobacter sp. R39]
MNTTALTATVALLGVITLLLTVMVFGLARQIGILHERIAPMGAMVNDRGPAIGELAPVITVTTIDGHTVQTGGPQPEDKAQLVLFVSPSCPICKKLLPLLESFGASEQLNVLLIGDGDPAEQAKMRKAFAIEGIPYANSVEIGQTFRVSKLPYAVLIDESGIIRSKGLVNSREHLESLVIAKESGYGTIQDYLIGEGGVAPPKGHKAVQH